MSSRCRSGRRSSASGSPAPVVGVGSAGGAGQLGGVAGLLHRGDQVRGGDVRR